MITTINEFRKLNENNNQQVILFVKNNSYFELDNESDDSVTFITRDNGDVGSEQPGQSDISEANRLKSVIMNKFGYACQIELVDEWVYLTVILTTKTKKISYAIFKHSAPLKGDWRGFGKSYPLEELSKMITQWTDIDTETADRYVQDLKDAAYNDIDFTTQYVDIKLPSNAMGYNWTIRKSTK